MTFAWAELASSRPRASVTAPTATRNWPPCLTLPAPPRLGIRLQDRRRHGSALVMLDDAIDDLVLRRLLGAHEVVALRVLGDLVERLAGVPGDDLVEPLADVDDLAGVDLDIRRLALKPARHLVDEDLRVR